MNSQVTRDTEHGGRPTSVDMGRPTGVDVGRPAGVDMGRPAHVMVDGGVFNGMARMSVTDAVPVGQHFDELSVESQAVWSRGAAETQHSVLVDDDFDVCIAGCELNAASAAESAAVIAPAAAAAVVMPQRDVAANGYQCNVSAALEPQPAAAAAAAAVGIPSSMNAEVLLWMYDDCVPSLQPVSASQLPTQLSFVLLYVDDDDSAFFWSALLYDDMVR